MYVMYVFLLSFILLNNNNYIYNKIKYKKNVLS